MRELDNDRPPALSGRGNQDVTVTFMPCMSSVDDFLIFVFLGLENDEIDTKIVFSCVICIEEIKHGYGNCDVTVAC